MAIPGDLKEAPAILAVGGIFLFMGLWVIITFIRNKHLRAYPASLVFSRALCNFIFGMLLFSQMAFIRESNQSVCGFLGGIWFCFSFASDCYFAALAYDLYATLSNPFRHIAASIRMIHAFVWLVSISAMVILGALQAFAFRKTFGTCFTKQTTNFARANWRNFVAIYIPNGLSNAFGIASLAYAYKRMRVGLDESWELRQKVINEMLVLTVTFTLNSLAIFLVWLIGVYVPAASGRGLSQESHVPFVLLTTTFTSRSAADAISWFFLKYFRNLKDNLDCCKHSCNCIDHHVKKDSPLRFSRTFIELEPEEHVSVALRQEVIEYMKAGIMRTLTRAQSRTRRGTSVRDVTQLETKQAGHGDEPTEPPPSSELYPVGMDDRDEKRVDFFDIGSETSAEVPFVDYAPHVFRYLRKQIYHKSDTDYRMSIDEGAANDIARTKFVDGGRSGAFLFFTGDGQHLIKTLSTEELKFCLRILPHYVKHLADNSGRTLITKFYGLHSLELFNIKIHFIVMDNVFVSGKNPDQKYDLKGSYVARHTNHHVEAGKLMKDEDFRTVLRLENSTAVELYRTMKYDTEFLASQNIMDYSLLLGMYYEEVPRQMDVIPKHLFDEDEGDERESLQTPASRQMRFDSEHVETIEMEEMGGNTGTEVLLTPGATRKKAKLNSDDFEHTDEARVFRAPCIYGPGTYCMGIIDILAEYGWFKRAERFAKTYFLMNDPNGISVNPPGPYRDRFLKFMGERVLGLNEGDMTSIV